MGQVKFFQQMDAEKCDYVVVIIIIIKNNNNNNNNGLTIEIQSMWNVKTKVMTTGTISKSFIKYLSNIPGKHEIKKMYRKQPNWGLCTFLGKYKCKSKKRLS